MEFKLLYLYIIYMDELTCVLQREYFSSTPVDSCRNFGWMWALLINLQNENWEIPRNIGMYTSVIRDILIE